jgi:hypothetical protein
VKSYHIIREHLSALEHEQWTAWSKAIAKELHDIKVLCYMGKTTEAIQKINGRLNRWEKNWKPYNKLSDDMKEFDREWADKVLDGLPVKCPVYQCGGLMITKERAYPKGMNEDDFPDGRAGDNQLPDLVCTNCKAIYSFQRFKNKSVSKRKED